MGIIDEQLKAPPAIGNERQMPAGEHQAAYEDAAHMSMARPDASGSTSNYASTSGGGSPGIVNAATVGNVGAAPGGPAAPTGESYKPVTAEVQSNQTVQGQLGDILKNGNPLLEGAKARAQQQANSRGLQNSSMATQAGEEAVVNAALPIAQQDAGTYQKQALTNQDISNQFLSMDKGAKLDLEKAYAAFQQNDYLFDKDSSLKRYISDSGNSTQEKVAAMQAASQASSSASSSAASMYATDARLKEAGMTLEAQTEMQKAGFTQQDKVTLAGFQQQNFQQFSQGINQINLADIPPESKQTAMTSWLAVNTGVPMPINIDMSAFRGTSPVPAEAPKP